MSGPSSPVLSLTVCGLPSSKEAYKNAVFVSPAVFNQLGFAAGKPAHIKIAFAQVGQRAKRREIVNLCLPLSAITDDSIGLSSPIRGVIGASNEDTVACTKWEPQPDANHQAMSLTFEVGLFQKQHTFMDEDQAADIVERRFGEQIFYEHQKLVADFEGVTLSFLVKSVFVASVDGKAGRIAADYAFAQPGNRTDINFTVDAKNKLLHFKESKQRQSIMSPDFNFTDMGIGGLDDEFGQIFRRAFASRMMPPTLIERLGINHVRGLLLYGPPGTGKTLIARQIGKMLHGREPIVINGPEILNKYVGAAEEKIRELFVEAEKDQAENGNESDLHIIIFDEIDAITRQRGTVSGSTGVHDTIVNQLLAKMDGVNSLNNILIIGMTNRKDMMDEALLRPGRFEVHVEIGLPDQKGRVQIIDIHTRRIRENGLLGDDVSIEVLAEKTKNFSGAEIEGLVKSAVSFAYFGSVDAVSGEEINFDEETMADTKVDMDAFLFALEECPPAFGQQEDALKHHTRNGIIDHGEAFRNARDSARNLVQQVRKSSKTPLLSLLLHGNPACGKTALAASLALHADFPYMKFISPDDFVGRGDSVICAKISKVFEDAYKSPLSLIVLDDIERLLGFVQVGGARFSNVVLQALLVLIKKVPPEGHRLCVIGTTANWAVLDDMQFGQVFNTRIAVPDPATPDEIAKIFEAECQGATSSAELTKIRGIFDPPHAIGIKKLMLAIEMARNKDDNDPSVTFDKFEQSLRDCGVFPRESRLY